MADIVNLDEVNETFQAELVIGAEWMDPRLAFDPVQVGADQKLFQGAWQFAEVFAGWWPQLLIVNEVGNGALNAVRVVVHSDGRVRFMEQRSVTLETPMQLAQFPFDRQKLEARIISFGDHSDQVLLKVDERILGATEEFVKRHRKVDIAQWEFESLELTSGTADVRYYGGNKVYSKIDLAISLKRQSANFVWKIIFPLIVLVLLMWAVFWLEVDNLSERLNLAFIGVLTIIAYQFIVDGTMPRISYFTFTDIILVYSFVTMALAIFESVIVYSLYRAGHQPLAERVDLIAQWTFPMVYFFGLAVSYVYYQL
ncbi:MAG: hypothetical protein A49_30990 [Methyloceanibacter sp.]|nr:MAG: hypothetical protein A49_30990 [Methyloceanibacter sp.]